MGKDFIYKYTLKRQGLLSGIKITIRPDNKIMVTAPNLLPVKMIERQLLEKKDWIDNCLSQNQSRAKNTNDKVQILGKMYDKVVGYWPDEKLGVSILQVGVEKAQIRVNNIKLADFNNKDSDATLPSLAEDKITDFLKLTAEKYIRLRLPVIAEKMNLAGAYKRVSLKKQMTRWGSCSSDKNLNFNWTLIHYAPEVIDYVLIHELAHLSEMNHSAKFWAIVAKYDAEYKRHQRILKS